MSFLARTRMAICSGRFLTATLGLGLCLPLVAEKPPAASFRIPLANLGFPGYAPVLLRVGTYSMSTMHLLDNNHLLFTYSMRTLVPRLPGDDVNDSDRLVAAEILELPSGKVLARTQWRLHDHGRYLWRAGQGVFVLRTADELSTFAPLRGLASGTAFQRVALPHRPGLPQIVASSPDGAILMLEVQRPEDDAVSGDDDSGTPKPKHTTIEFFRISAPEQQDAPIELTSAGAVGAPGLLRLVLDGDGYLWAEDVSRNNWQVSFNEYGGRSQNLTTIHSSCAPRVSLLSRGEFLLESCQGINDSPMLSVYGFDGHEDWEEPFSEDLQPPTVVAAPQGGRFVLSRLIANKSGTGIYDLAPDDPLSQEIRVYQTGSGDMLLRLQCAVPERTAENFDLSPDGSTLAVLGRDAIEIYKLPPLTARDRKDLADVRTMTPPLSHGPVVLARITRPVGSERKLLKVEDRAEGTAGPSGTGVADGGGSGDPAAGGSGSAGSGAGDATVKPAAVADAGSAPAAPGAVADGPRASKAAPETAGQTAGQTAQSQGAAPAAAGDAVSTHRKPPTLLNPGESAEFKGPSGSPQ